MRLPNSALSFLLYGNWYKSPLIDDRKKKESRDISKTESHI